MYGSVEEFQVGNYCSSSIILISLLDSFRIRDFKPLNTFLSLGKIVVMMLIIFIIIVFCVVSHMYGSGWV